MELIKKKLTQKIKDVSEAQEIVREEKLVAFLKGEMLGLKIALETIEKGEKNENQKV